MSTGIQMRDPGNVTGRFLEIGTHFTARVYVEMLALYPDSI